jgi:hypothetical protein
MSPNVVCSVAALASGDGSARVGPEGAATARSSSVGRSLKMSRSPDFSSLRAQGVS